MSCTARRRRLTPSPGWLGAAVGLAGVGAMIGPEFRRPSGDTAPEWRRSAPAVCYAIASLFGAPLSSRSASADRRRDRPITAGLLAAPRLAAESWPWSLAGAGRGRPAALAAIGLFSTALAYVLYFRILAGAGATNVVLVTLLAPVTSLSSGRWCSAKLSALGTFSDSV